jgi:ferritin-like metal-binding protein YciE
MYRLNSKNIQTPQIKNLRSTKRTNKLREDFNKHQSETKQTIKKEICEIKKTTQAIKEEFSRYGRPEKKRVKQKSWK